MEADIPIILAIEDFSTTIKHDRGHIRIYSDGSIQVVGSVKEAALAFAKYIFFTEFSDGLVSFELNKSIRVDFRKNFEMTCLLKEKPPFFDELAAEFKKIVSMKMFW